MRVGIDAHMVGRKETGNETYTFNLIEGLSEIDRENGYVVYALQTNGLQGRLRLPENFRTAMVRPAPSLLRVPFAMPWNAWRHGLDILHVTYNAPPLCPCATVVSVHDISFRLHPEWFSPRDRLVLSAAVPLSMRRAARVLALSEHSKRDIVREYGVPADKIVVTPLAAARHYRPARDEDALAAIRAKYGLERRFILAVGNLQPRKNLTRLLEAYRRLLGAAGLGADDLPQLAIVGRSLWRGSEIVQLVQAYGLQRKVVLTGYVPEADLPGVYNAALALAYPSLYEGFGLPVLEAMACGTPVMATNASAVPEVAGDAALVFDPRSVDEMAQALHDLLHHEELRRELAAKGQARARLFTWERTARLTLDTYRQVWRESRRGAASG